MPFLAANLKRLQSRVLCMHALLLHATAARTGASNIGVRGQDSITTYRHGARVLLCNDLRPGWDVISICKATASSQVMSCKV